MGFPLHRTWRPARLGPLLTTVSESPEVSLAELQLAARNHGMPLEALRYDVTPVGLHYLLIHFDIPAVDGSSWRLAIDGDVATPASLSLEDVRALPRVTMPVTLECAGNGRARLSPRPISQPWLNDAVGTAEWTGTPLAPLLRRAGIGGDAVEVLFTASPGLTAACREASSTPTSEAFRSTRSSNATCCSPMRSTGSRSRPSTGIPCGSSCRGGTG
jgi:sulfane dehydrogenase subunit SoxC